MKEITREDWENNPTPRMMWVWDNDESDKTKMLVIHCLTCKDLVYSFVAAESDGRSVTRWRHCAEIEESERWSNYELAKWLAEGASCGEFRQCKYDASYTVFTNYAYYDGTDNEPCSDNILIRVNGGKWREPYNIPPECISPTPDEIGG